MVARIFALLALVQCCHGVNNTACVGKVVQFRLMRDSKKCLDVRGGQATDGAQLQIWDCNGHTNQNFVWCSDGRIVSAVKTDMCLDVPGDDPTKPNNLQLWQCNGRGGQYWEFDPKNLAVFPPTAGEKMCVDVSGGSDTNGAPVNLYYCSPGSGEKWYVGQGPPPLPECDGGKGVVKYFQLNDDTTKCMEAPYTKTPGTTVQISACNGKDNQKWIWCSDGRIVSRIDDTMCLDVPGGDPSKASNLQIWPCNRAAGQYWGYDNNAMAISPTQGWQFDKMCLDVSGGSTSPGTRVITYPCSPGGKWQAQKWQINKAATEASVSV